MKTAGCFNIAFRLPSNGLKLFRHINFVFGVRLSINELTAF